METVKELLAQSKEKAQQLNLTETDLVLDHAIYSKAVEVVMDERHPDLRDFINLRMGFHATCVFLGATGKQFGDAGLKDVMVETGILGEDTAQKVLRGKHYNNGKSTRLCVAQVMTRVKLDAFLEWLSQDLFTLYEEFEDEFSNEKLFPIAVFWNSYLSVVQTLRGNINNRLP